VIRRWLGIALLAFSWLWGLGYYHHADWPEWFTSTVTGHRLAVIPLWVLPVVVGVLLLAGAASRLPGRWIAGAAIVLLVPAIVLAPWPHRAGLVLIAVGLAFAFLPRDRRLWERLGGGGVVAGVVLLAQSVVMFTYETLTAYSHDLPAPLVWLMVRVARLSGIDAAYNGTNIVLGSMRVTNHLAPTWDLFLPPTTACFLVGGLVFLAVRVWADGPPNGRGRSFGKAAGALLVAVALWLPLRAGLQMTLYMHRILRTGYDDPIVVAHQLWSSWLLALFLIGPALLAWRFARIRSGADLPEPAAAAPPRRVLDILMPVSAVLALVGVAALTAAIFWTPVGPRKGGRLLFDEHLSQWESTERAYDTEWYEKDETLGIGQKAAYNYGALYDYCSRFYDVSRFGTQLGRQTGKNRDLRVQLTDEELRKCDVFVVKCPTLRYSPAEIQAIRRFVENGGGLMLIGEHTNVFKTGVGLNDIAKEFGVRFRYDCLFGPDDEPFDQGWPPEEYDFDFGGGSRCVSGDVAFDGRSRPSLVRHPITQRMPPMDYAISCSIEPEFGSGRTVARGRTLKSLPAFYHASNYYPAVNDHPYMRFGSFIQCWATRYGKGRVVAFSDSTIFSTFSMFEPGKTDLWLGMVEWCNRENAFDPRALLTVVGLMLLVAAVVPLMWATRGTWIIVLAAGTLGWTGAVGAVRASHDEAMPAPPVREGQPFVNIIIDRTVSNSHVSKSGFVGSSEGGFSLFERWMLRRPYITTTEGGRETKKLREGYFTSRRAGDDAFTGDLLVFLHPNHEPPPGFVDGLVRYVQDGGRVLVLDSPQNALAVPDWFLGFQGLYSRETATSFASTLALDGASTANSLLEPFGMSTTRPLETGGNLDVPEGWPSVAVTGACAVEGGRPLARLKGRTVAATKQVGKGSVTVIGFGQRFTDPKMGVVGDTAPSKALREVFDFEFELLPAIIEDRLPTLPEPTGRSEETEP